MANGIINLILKSTAVGSGFDDVRKQTSELIAGTTDLSKAAKSLGQVFGDVGNLAGQVFGNLLKGGIWSVAAEGVKFLVGKWKEHKEAVEKSLEAERKAFDERVAKVEQYTQAMKRADETAARANSHIDALKAEREEIARNIKATNELERQRRIAAGENAETVNADIDSRNVSNDRFAKASAAADMEKKAENDLAAAREKAKLSESAVNKLIADRAKLISDIHKRAQAVWADEHKFAANAGYRLKTSEEKSYMSGRGDKDYDEKLKQLADLEKKIAEKKHEQVKASDALADAATKHTAALERVKSVEAENHAAALKDANERAAAEKAAEDARLEAVAKNLEEARAAKEKRMQDAADSEAEFQHLLDKQLEEARIKAERKENEQKLENMKKAHAEQMKLLDEQIAKAKSEAAVWEQNAQRTRDFVRNNGGGFAAWNAQQNDEALYYNGKYWLVASAAVEAPEDALSIDFGTEGVFTRESIFAPVSPDDTLAKTSELAAAAAAATNYTDAATNALAQSSAAAFMPASFTETDPTIKPWAKAATKPSYTAAEVGATSIEDVYRLIAGTNVVLVVTNYNSATHAPAMTLQHLDPQSGEYVTYWDEQRRHDMTLTNAMQYTDAAIETRAPRAWSGTTSGLGSEAPAGVTWISTPETVIAGGYEYEKVITSAGAVWVLASNGLTTGATTNAFFRVSASDGTELFSIEKTDSYLIGVSADDITRSGNTVTIPVNIVAEAHPYVRASTNLVNAVWAKEDENGFTCPWATVSWSGTTGAYVATITCSQPQAFFYFEYMAEGVAKIKNSAKTEMSGGIIFNGTTYMPTVNGNKLEFVAQ